jgi:hypothetical protein
MITFLIILSIPTAIALVALLIFRKEVTWVEFAMQIGAAALIASIGIAVSYESRIADRELWNGQVTSRSMERVPCSHSYSCNCRTVSYGSGRNRSTSTVCDTCYRHAFDQDWDVAASTGETLSIDRIDEQGLEMPPRWAKVYVGEPFTSEHSYDNYILASPTSVLLGAQGDVNRFKALIPAYPSVYDIYHVHHFLLEGNYPGFDVKDWSYLVDEANKQLGPKKQVNIIVIVVQTDDQTYADALRTAWVGGKKNDVIIVIGSEDGHKIDWTNIVTWSPREDYKVLLRDAINQAGSLDMRDVIAQTIVTQTNANFERMHMKKMKYLMSSSEMPMVQVICVLILATLVELGIAWWSINNEFTNE